ncbi:MRR1 [Candida jiufengensis]|uniref:MRR1 n=1 Tax=Candida jiufengensis TaxID=497108 RepID=UPI002224FA61|nr:MRR1 [Candida jiufengensis]KAI5952663.1 MRR1 [Candida jiufengensis]
MSTIPQLTPPQPQQQQQQQSDQKSKQTNQPSRKRNRPSLVCTNCKSRKIKCDRQLPCSNCIKSRKKVVCTYDDECPKTNDQSNKTQNNIQPYEQSARQPIKFANQQITPPYIQGNQNLQEQNNNKLIGSKRNSNSSINSNESKKSKVSSSSSTTTANEDQVALEELKFLKQRIESMESKLHQSQSNSNQQTPTSHNNQNSRNFNNISQQTLYSVPSPVLPPPSSNVSHSWSPGASTLGSTQSQPSQYTTSYNLSDTRVRSPPVQLPPITLKEYYSPYESSISSNSNKPSPLNNPPINSNSNDSMDGINPYLNDTETINFFENYSSVFCKDYKRINYGPFAWSSMMRRDEVLSLLWKHVGKQKESTQDLAICPANAEINQENTIIVTNESDESEGGFKKRMLESNGYSDVVPYDLLKEKLKKKINKDTLPLEMSLYEGQFSCEFQLIDRIRQVFPAKKVIWKLIDRFFTYCYPFMPFLDEQDFLDSVIKIIGPRSYEEKPIENLKIEKRLDLAIVGVLLIVMRITYLSLFSNKLQVNEERLTTNDPSEKAQDIKYLMQNPISIISINLATFCLYQFDILRRTSMPVLQLAFYIRFYYMFAPEDGDDGDGSDTNAFSALLIQMAYSLGLNREPEKFPGILQNQRMNHLGRKIWHVLVLGDLHQAYAFGSPMLVDPDSFDTKIPFSNKENSNVIDYELDKKITDVFFPKSLKLYEKLRAILKRVLCIAGSSKVSEICNLISEFEVSMGENFSSLKNLLVITPGSHIFERNFKAKFYISLKSFFVSIYFHIFLHYEHKDVGLAFFYLKKILKIAAIDLMPHYFELMGNSEVICDMFINPKLQQIIHKLNQVYFALIIRVNLSIYGLKSKPDHEKRCYSDTQYYEYYKELCKFSSCLTRCAEVSIAAVSKLSSRYFYAWKLTKSHTYLLKIITTMDFYKDQFVDNKTTLKLPDFSTIQIEEIVVMCEKALKILGKDGLLGNEFCKDVTYKQYKHQNSVSSTGSGSTTSNSLNKLTPNSDISITDARTYTNEFGLDVATNQEIDKIWLQMLQQQQQQQIPQNSQENPAAANLQPQQPLSQQQQQPLQQQQQQQHPSNQFPQTPQFNDIYGSGRNYSPFPTNWQTGSTPYTSFDQSQFNGNTNGGINSVTNSFNGGVGFTALPNGGFGFEENGSFDFFADLPFDQMFNVK